MNIVIVKGHLSRPPERHALPSGDVVAGYEITVAATEGRRAESVPVSWPDPPASAFDVEPDTEMVVVGRVRRRFFKAGGGTQSRTEVVADAVIPARQKKRAERVVLGALAGAEAALVT